MHIDKKFTNGMQLRMEEGWFSTTQTKNGIDHIVGDEEKFYLNVTLQNGYILETSISKEELKKNRKTIYMTALKRLIEDLEGVCEELNRETEKEKPSLKENEKEL